MKYLKKYQLFESITGDAFEKLNKLKQDFENGIEEVKTEYVKSVSDCLYDITDNYDFTTNVKLNDKMLSIGGELNHQNISSLISILCTFPKIPVEKIDDFFETLSGLTDLVKDHVSEEKDIVPITIALNKEDGNAVAFKHFTKIEPLQDVKIWVDKNLEHISDQVKSVSLIIKI
jgi:hypothetical protein